MRAEIVRRSEVMAEPGKPLSAEYWADKRQADLLYLRSYPQARNVYAAILKLVRQGRTGNNSQIASYTGLSRNHVAEVTGILRQRGWIVNKGKGAAYHWRPTGKPMPPVPDGEPGPPGLAKMFPLGS